ncbi:40S ribosomal protein S7 [Pholiota conissans]|uniref:40S ribosomal protein S7 n=1 Tax=Pholiota conissans TaxID=109636 RepID=A0A9P5Z6N0_9AGAR|nr:40S ribosomal protein S7 [Pholiota conissans]
MVGPAPKERPSEEEVLAAFDSVPLFMKSLPEDDSDPTLSALQSLIYEGTPDEIAQNFKEQGNEYFKGKRYREALGFYTQGVDAKPADNTILEALLCNRAACNLELQNYGSVLRDCSKVLSINPKSSKAFYRSATALVNLGRYDEAEDCCVRCLSYDVDNAGVKAIQQRGLKLKEEAEKKEREKQERIKKEEDAKLALKMALRERNLIIFNKPGGSVSPVQPHFDTEDPTGSTLVLPVFFLYPQYATSDIISDFVEDTTFAAHIEVMFPPQAPPPEWDKKGEYTPGNLVVYATTYRKRLLKVGKKKTLRDVCKEAKAKEEQPMDGLQIRDGCIYFVVLPKGPEETKWIEEFKKTREDAGRNWDGLWAGWNDWRLDVDLAFCRALLVKMSTITSKIQRTANAPTTPPDETEKSVAQALIDLENNVPELKNELRALQISAAREVDVRGGKKAIVIFVPVPQLKAFHKVQQRLTRELEKKFSDRHVVFIAQRRMLRKPTRNSRVKQKRPRSRTLTSVHEKILEDLVYPTEIVGKRTRVAVDGSKLLKVLLDSKDATSLEYKLDSFSSVYRRLTGKDVVFEFPVVSQE